MRTSAYLVITCLILAACGTSKQVSNGAQTDVERGAALYPGYSLAKLTQGRNLYEGNCGTCHSLFDPKSQTAEEWGMINPRMVKKANKKAGMQVINQEQEELILQYLVTMSTAPRN